MMILNGLISVVVINTVPKSNIMEERVYFSPHFQTVIGANQGRIPAEIMEEYC